MKKFFLCTMKCVKIENEGTKKFIWTEKFVRLWEKFSFEYNFVFSEKLKSERRKILLKLSGEEILGKPRKFDLFETRNRKVLLKSRLSNKHAHIPWVLHACFYWRSSCPHFQSKKLQRKDIEQPAYPIKIKNECNVCVISDLWIIKSIWILGNIKGT